MSQAISVGNFTTFFVLYAFVSLAVYFTASFTIPAWLIYFFFLLPFYLICIVYLMDLNLRHYQKSLRYKRLPLFLSVIFQLLIILTSPTSCYGWSQGKACYSFIQTHLTTTKLATLQNTPPAWWIVDSMLVPALILHVISVAMFLKMIRIEQQ
ncbi:hypothetical protein JOY44_03500 [Phormidium sp. CLA17]|uniref:hypothetical protein n=1 Tax=Leptolyngbya sp. Cla-17 TaxID=2803751 RepID=UPI001492EBB7|nr:hypothetical protein [Leptolyngbya sp. Cla-17]MBM0740692.1 hypothetical protein [Leptolyngbya sp. Cla-17]